MKISFEPVHREPVVCSICGAAVADEIQHRLFHRNLAILLGVMDPDDETWQPTTVDGVRSHRPMTTEQDRLVRQVAEDDIRKMRLRRDGE